MDKKPRGRPKKIVTEDKNVMKSIELMKKMTIDAYKTTDLYIYHEGNNIDTLNYIKEFQTELDKISISSQVVICSNEHVENVGINNCFNTKDKPLQWTSFSLKFPTKCMRFLERPRHTPKDLVVFAKEMSDYKDEVIEIMLLK